MEWQEVSGELTDDQKRLGWPLGYLTGHTEYKALTRINIKPRSTLVLRGEVAPCPFCRSIMRYEARKGEGTIHYEWVEGDAVMRWSTVRGD